VNTVEGSTAKDKNVRYDRQLRLWGILGQMAIENVFLGVLGSNSTAGEVLKNLVLPGIGSYEIIDDAKVTERDLGNNFYVTQESKGTSRGVELVKNLNEMNPFVKGECHQENPIKLVETNINYFAKFNVICACQMPTSTVNKLAKFAWEHNIPFFNARSYGFLGYIRIVLPELRIYENHDPEFKDLRLNDPFPEFQQFAENFDIDVLKETNLTAGERLAKHLDIPWLILAPTLRKRWKEKVGDIDEDEAEDSFKQFVKSSRLVDPDPQKNGALADEENYEELANNAWLVVKYEEYYNIPQNVQDVFDDDKININADSDKFWVLANALKSFVEKEGQGKHLPLTGALPDMNGSTVNYLSLQKVYKDKSNQDIKSFNEHLQNAIKKVGKFKHFTEIDNIEFERFFKNARFIEVSRYRSIEQEYSSWNVDELSIHTSNTWDDNSKNVVWYLLFRAADRFFDKHGRYPGNTDETYESDIKIMQGLAQDIAKESGLDWSNFPNLNDYAHEMTRYGGGELHNVASIVGGTVAQEVIKTVTGQWVAANNTWIFSGINSSSLLFQA